MTGKKAFHGYLDRLRENLETLDEEIKNARRMSKVGKKGDARTALQWAKTLRDLVELRERTLLNIKAHLLGRDATGAVNEPDDVWRGNAQVEYERLFHSEMAPWTQEDLKLKCEECGRKSEEVSTRYIRHRNGIVERPDLCNRCYKNLESLKEYIESLSPEELDKFESSIQESSASEPEDVATFLAKTTISFPEPQKSQAIQEFKRLNRTDVLEKIKALEAEKQSTTDSQE